MLLASDASGIIHRFNCLMTTFVCNREEGDTITNLCMAVGLGFTTMVQKLIEAGADVNALST